MKTKQCYEHHTKCNGTKCNRAPQCQGGDHQYNPCSFDGTCIECGGIEPKEI